MAVDATKTKVVPLQNEDDLNQVITASKSKAEAEGLRYISIGEGEVPFPDGESSITVTGVNARNRYGSSDKGPYLLQDLWIECTHNGSTKYFPAPTSEGKSLIASVGKTVTVTVERQKANDGNMYKRIAAFKYTITAAKPRKEKVEADI